MSLSGSPANGGPLNGASSLTWLGEASCIILEHSIASAVCSLGETPPGPTQDASIGSLGPLTEASALSG